MAVDNLVWTPKPLNPLRNLDNQLDLLHTHFAMTKRKAGTFSATKAVKANARERVGQPKPARVVEDKPRTGRRAKHKPKLEQVIRQEE